MEYTKATIDDMEEFYDLVQNTIQEVYPKYYPEEVVRFFSQQHCWENLERDLEEERIYILQDGECVIGAGSFEGNHITRVFVRKDYQRHGVGSLIMQRLEDVIAREGTVQFAMKSGL